jgi:hypothetical protein
MIPSFHPLFAGRWETAAPVIPPPGFIADDFCKHGDYPPLLDEVSKSICPLAWLPEQAFSRHDNRWLNSRWRH